MEKIKSLWGLISLGFIADLASLIGLLISLWTFIIVFSIKKKILFRLKISKHIENLNAMSSEISGWLNSYKDNCELIDEKIALADVELRMIESGCSGNLLKDVKKSRGAIELYLGAIKINRTEVKAREIKTSLSVVTAEMMNHKEIVAIGS